VGGWDDRMPAIFPIIRSGYLGQFEDICGTGFLISPSGYFLTCFHLFEEYPDATYSASLQPADLTAQSPISRVVWSAGYDWLVGNISGGRRTAPFMLAEGLPPPHTSINISGYRGGVFRDASGSYRARSSKLRTYRGRYISYCNEFNIPRTWETIKFSAKRFPAILSSVAVPSGFSGGPVSNPNGRVIGIHSCISTNSDPQFNEGHSFAVNVSMEALWDTLRRELPELAAELSGHCN
jgi:hypothetical protein